MSVVIAYPNTMASAIIGQKSLECLYDVSFFMPNTIDESFGTHMLEDLQCIAAMSGQSVVTKVSDPDFSGEEIAIVVFPCLGRTLYLTSSTKCGLKGPYTESYFFSLRPDSRDASTSQRQS